MPRFIFRLDPLLRARRAEEQRHQRDVAIIERQRMALEEVIRGHQSAIVSGKSALRDRLGGALDTSSLRLEASQTQQHLRDAQRAAVELAGVHQRLGQARNLLLDATRRRKALELLREKRFDEWKRRIDKAETDALDELAVNAAFGRRSADETS